jgi:hypothetical protein
MKQNKYFSPQRFVRLFRNDLLINQKAYLYTPIGLLIAVYILSLLGLRNSNPSYVQNAVYLPNFIFYLLGIISLISTSFPALKDQIKTSNYLLLPGSTIEKYLLQFVVRIVIFIPLALVIFWIGTHLAKASLLPNPERGFDPSKIPYFYFSDLFKNVPSFRDKLVIITSIFSLATLLFAGSAYFNRFALVKTAIVVAVVSFLVILTFVCFSHIFYPDETMGFDMKLKIYEITDNINNVQLAAYLLGCLSWIFFLVLGYFKLKEKEI